jgi:hypothetical protein
MAIPILGDIIDAVSNLAGKAIVDKDKKNEILYKLQELKDKGDERLHQELMGQIEVNKVEAASGSLFVAGWRPFIGWVGGAGLAWSFIIGPAVEYFARFRGFTGSLPEFNFEQLITIVLAMLGVGAMRSFEKVKGVSTNDFTDVPGRTQSGNAGANVKVTPGGSVSVQT